MYSAYKLNKQGPQNGVSHPNPGGVVRSFIVKGRVADTEWVCAGPCLFNLYAEYIYAKAFDCVDHNKLWKILKEMGIQDHLTCILRNLYAGQEATVRTGHGTTDWFQIGKGVRQGCIL